MSAISVKGVLAVVTHLHTWGLAVALAAGLLPSALGAAPAGCLIVEGMAIGGVRLGMEVRAALVVTGAPQREQVDGTQVLYTLRMPWSQMIADYGVVEYVSTQAPVCATAGGIGPGSTAAAVREAYAGATASLTTAAPQGIRLSYPLLGVAFLLRGERVVSVEIFGAASGAGTRWVTPPGPPGPSSPPALALWSIRASTWRIEDTALVVTGTVENHSRPASAFAEVAVFSPAGRLMGMSDGSFYPSPLPTGRASSFEARVAIDDVVSRYTVTVRPVGSITTTLAEQDVEIRSLQAFAPIVMRRLRVAVEFRNGPTRFLVTVTNGSSAVVSSATVAVDIAGVCFIQMGDLIRSLEYRGTGVAVVPHIRAGGSAQTIMPMPPDAPGGCQDLATASTAARILSIRVGD